LPYLFDYFEQISQRLLSSAQPKNINTRLQSKAYLGGKERATQEFLVAFEHLDKLDHSPVGFFQFTGQAVASRVNNKQKYCWDLRTAFALRFKRT